MAVGNLGKRQFRSSEITTDRTNERLNVPIWNFNRLEHEDRTKQSLPVPGIRVPMCVCECARKRNAGVPAKLSKQRARGSPFGIDTMRARSPITHQHTTIYSHRLTLYHQHVFMFSDNSEMTNTMVDSWVCFDACFEYRSNNSYVILQRFLDHNESFNIILERQQEANDKKSLCKTVEELMEETKYCRSIFTPLSFWGANIVVFANVIYILPYLIVILIYSTVSGLRKRAYDSAVLCYNVSQVVLNSILIAVGWSLLCRVSLYFSVYTISCLALMFLSISSTFWLFVICIDMTLVITRLRWTPPSDPKQQRAQERRKFLIYSVWVWVYPSCRRLLLVSSNYRL